MQHEPSLLPIDEYRDQLVLELYGRLGLLRDLQGMHALGRKPQLGSYAVLLELAQTSLWNVKWKLIRLVGDNPALYEETFRALRYSPDPYIATVAEVLPAPDVPKS